MLEVDADPMEKGHRPPYRVETQQAKEMKAQEVRIVAGGSLLN